jgi:hypothetical protein
MLYGCKALFFVIRVHVNAAMCIDLDKAHARVVASGSEACEQDPLPSINLRADTPQRFLRVGAT